MLVERAEPNFGNVVFRSRNAERDVRWEVVEDLDAALRSIKPYQDHAASDTASEAKRDAAKTPGSVHGF